MMNSFEYPRYMRIAVALACCLCTFSVGAASSNAPDIAAPISTVTGSAGLGVATRIQNSLYLDAGTRRDLFPRYLYEGKHVFLESDRIGLKLNEALDQGFKLFLGYRFEGFPYDRIPTSLAGMDNRSQGVDLGFAYQYHSTMGTVFTELLHDAGDDSNGTEIRVGYFYDWTMGKLQLKPQFILAARDSNLNNYYYGIRTKEVTIARPAYAPGSGINTELGISAQYQISQRWRLIGGVSATRLAASVRASPVVENRPQLAGLAGFAYDFSPEHNIWPEGRPLTVKLLYGSSSDCTLANIILLSCNLNSSAEQTNIEAIEFGRPFIEQLNGWPLDFVGYVGVLHQDEHGLQDNAMQLNVYMKGYYYGFPWRERVRTRLGFGVGLSYAQRVPFIERRDQTERGRNNSNLLNYLNPSIDFSIGDVLNMKSMHETYLGLGVSHRSGIFGSSKLLGNVDGGSNYVYSYIEWLK